MMPSNYDIAEELKKLGSSLTDAIPQTPYKIPTAYFEGLAQQVMQQIKHQEVQEELAINSPLLAKASKQNVYAIPAGYFETLSPYSTKHKEVGVLRRLPKTKLLRFAAAASLIAIVCTITFFLIRNSQPAQEMALQKTITNEASFNQELAMLSEQEIYNYLLSTGDLADTETISAWIDPEQLPAEASYMDERFMEDYFIEEEKKLPKHL